jgi:sugar phosphate isomerase/epimerase
MIILWIDMETFKNKFPFKLGTTSYVLSEREDNLMANVRFLMDRFDMIQLLFMGRNHLHEVMSPSIIRRLGQAREKSGVLFTVHLPADLDLLNPDADTVRGSVGVIERIISSTRSLDVWGYVLHVDRFINGSGRADPGEKGLATFRASLEVLADGLGSDSGNVYIENTTYDLIPFKETMAGLPFPVCMDAGHLFFLGQDYEGFTDAFGGMVMQIHLHGFRNGKDHVAVSELEPRAMARIVDFQRRSPRPMILEVFNRDDLEKSARHLERYFFGSGKDVNLNHL